MSPKSQFHVFFIKQKTIFTDSTCRIRLSEIKMNSSRKNPYPPHERSSEIPRGEGLLEDKILDAKFIQAAKLDFLVRGGAKRKTFRGRSMDIFSNCTMFP